MQLENEDAARFLRGPDTIRDGYLESLVTREMNYRLVVELGFYVPGSSAGNYYELVLSDVEDIDYHFDRESAATQLAFVKCIWTADAQFYLSLDPWKESEEFISEQDENYFRANHARLVVSRRQPPEGATFR